ncbi:MAG TPA: glucoamylase family protein [Longimicrobiales bacterium]|nr:glucoamylase family protein [Longimicrobiales bacterium]
MPSTSAPDEPASATPVPRFLVETATEVAKAHRQALSDSTPFRRPSERLAGSGRELSDTYDTLARAAASGQPLTPGGSWFLDNFYIVPEARAEVLEETRGRFYRALPRLGSGPLEGYPRVTAVAEVLVDLVDGAVDRGSVVAFLEAYQAESPLTIAELWALPTMIRMALIRSLQRLAAQVRRAHRERAEAARWAREIAEAAASDEADALLLARGLTEEHDRLPEELLLHVIESLPTPRAGTALAGEWLERVLERAGRSMRDVVRQDTQRQIGVANAFTGLRWSIDARWGRIVESVSLLDRTLRRDPAGVYGRMDFQTRDRYRHAVEELARHSPHAEVEVAERLLHVVARAGEGSDGRGMGHHLLGPGAPAFEGEVGYSPPWSIRLRRLVWKMRGPLYFGTIAAITVAASWGLLAYASGRDASGVVLFLIGVVSLLPLLDLAIAFANRAVALVVAPRPLPKMDAERGLDDTHRTLVVVPTLLSDPDDALAQIERLEIHSRANPSPLLRYALLTDFADADEESRAGEAETLAAARSAIESLNERERDAWGDRFYLLHRGRRWNPAEGVWMGWERKRGKLEELNALLRDPDAPTSYEVMVGNFRGTTAGHAIRYVLTLDADTKLPPGAALDLVRTAAHPLNRPFFDPERRRITRGYGILQPRVAVSPRSSLRSPFARIFSGIVGLDPYTTAVSDVYQDLFEEGIFTGKGLYDVDAFRAALSEAIPANTVLSHDLLEGSHARAALVTDVEVFDDYPSTYPAFAKRLHRWTRGDWQILPWLTSRVRRQDGARARNPLSPLSRWRIADNLRRALTPAMVVAFLLVGWVIPLLNPFLWTVVALTVLAFPVYVQLTAAMFTRPRYARWLSYFDGVAEDMTSTLVQTALTLVFLPHLASTGIDATARALWRMGATRRGLLEWTTAKEAERRTLDTPGSYVGFMWFTEAWAAVAAGLTTWLAPSAWPVAAPFVAGWAVAPWVAWKLSHPAARPPQVLTPEDAAWLRGVAHLTWTFFDRFIGPETGWLPPDNVQAKPFRGVAARTSPTNVGLGLLALQSARDFGWLGRREVLARLERARATIDGLEHFRGHLLNWYSTSDGRTLWPRYVSTVDSGNFVASLVALGRAMAEFPDAELWRDEDVRGMRDHVAALGDLATAPPSSDSTSSRLPADAFSTLARLEATAAEGRSGDPVVWGSFLDRLQADAEAVREALDLPREDPRVTADPLSETLARLLVRIEEARDEVRRFVPWIARGESPPPEVVSARSPGELATALTGRPDDPLARAALAEVRGCLARAEDLGRWMRTTVEATDFRTLYDPEADLFFIGMNVDTLEPDAGRYDLLASEARLASFLAVAKGDVPLEHWFRLGRPTGVTDEGSVLLSWSGTMFEYLMPLLLTGSWPGTLLAETCEAAVDAQVRYADRAGLPWGISESAYNVLNLDLDYQYRAFGVPGLALKRGMSEDFVVAPYASALGAMIRPASAVDNLRRLGAEGAMGHYGFYDAIDYTPERVPVGQKSAIVSTWMAHHQAMTLLAASNVLDDDRLQRRFQRAALPRSAELLLQERIPRQIETTDPHPMETSVDPGERETPESAVIHLPADRLDDPTPPGQLLSNGRYDTFITQAGTGYSRYRDWELTRWEPGRSPDPHGVFFYLRDLDSGRRWSVTPLPAPSSPDRFDTWHHLSKVESALVYDWIESYVEVGVSPEDNVEVRRLTLTNYGEEPRRLDVTSYLEVVLNRVGADRAHPAFSKLFVETEALPERGTLLASRRPRRQGEAAPWMFHALAPAASPPEKAPMEFETDRAAFIGRGRTLASPAALRTGAVLGGASGPVLDPIFSLRQGVVLGPRQKVVLSFTLGVGADRGEALQLAERYQDPAAVQRALELAAAYGPAELQYLNVREAEALRYQPFAAAVLQADPRLRAPAAVLETNTRQQSGLWAYGISGDLPLVVVRVDSMDEVDRVQNVVRAAHFWRLRGLSVDILFLNEHPPSYAEGLQDRITAAIAAGTHRPGEGPARGADYVLRADQLPPEDRALLLTVAHAVFEGGLPAHLPPAAGSGRGTTPAPPHQLLSTPGPRLPARPYPREARPAAEVETAPPGVPVEMRDPGPGADAPEAESAGPTLDNGYGRFLEDGRYEIRVPVTDAGLHPPPLPWINVVANEGFGFTATSEGGGYTWSVNSRENRLTPWTNDPVTDRPGEATWLRDDGAGRYASLTPNPTPGPPGEYRIVHGFGRTDYHADFAGLESHLTLFVAVEDPVKLIRVRVRNTSAEPRALSLFRFQEWVMGVHRSDSTRFVITERDPVTGALTARNSYNQEFAGRVAFTHVVTESPTGEATADRAAFLGRRGDVFAPFAVEHQATLEERTGAGLDPCAAYRVPLHLAPGEEGTVTFLLGEAPTTGDAMALVAKFADQTAVDAELEAVTRRWEERLGRVRVRTPDPHLNRVMDGWLLYQALSCRIWARSAFYQSGGAFGFRDQLQDAMAMVYVDPALTRRQILLHAAHQFVEGDVLHWWHPPTGRGIRSRFTDDLLWLPYVTTFYVEATGDGQVLDARAGYLTARLLEPGEDEAYLVPTRAPADGDLYDHCCRALDRSLTRGRHGLPLMGSGDWNDGMNRVGAGGEGESVWLGFFLHAVLEGFLPFCETRGDHARVMRYRAYMEGLAEALDDGGWDGAWYRRAFYDDGTPLGSASNVECRIDAIAQAWAVLSKVAPPERVELALDAADAHLVDREGDVLRLLTPPFDETPRDPGYIKGYLPGVRENGGQYTHGVLWLVSAMARAGRTERAAELFRLLNPVSRSTGPLSAERYGVEPYVAVADVYSVAPHVGRGGWSWYTGSGAWMYRVALESILGFELAPGRIRLTPAPPPGWDHYEIDYTADDGVVYEIRVRRRGPGRRIVDARIAGRPLEPDPDGSVSIPLLGGEAGARLRAEVVIGDGSPPVPGGDQVGS